MATTSTTGISAMNVKGQTIHRFLGVVVMKQHPKNILNGLEFRDPNLRERIASTKIIAIDEISMLDSFQLDYIDFYLRSLMGINTSFGGKQIIFIGDLFQLPPVEINRPAEMWKGKQKIDLGGSKGYFFEADAFKNAEVETILLEKIYRQNDLQFIKALNNCRIGQLDQEDIYLLSSRLQCEPDKDDTILTSRRDSAAKINEIEYLKNNNEEFIFKAKDTSKAPEFLDKLNRDCLSPAVLKLKVGSRVMLTRNIDVYKGLCNGSLGVIIELDKEKIKVKFDNYAEWLSDKEDFEYTEGVEVKATRKQHPLMLAHAITIHKSQGLTLDNVYIKDFNRIFGSGMAYVAMSRARTLNGLKLDNFNANKIKVDERIINFYNELKGNR
jgi:ATP-dependent DNA helicase PIF1